MSEQDRQRRQASEFIEEHLPNIERLMRFINIGISHERLFIYMLEGADEFYGAYRLDVASVKQRGITREDVLNSLRKPRAGSDVSALASELTQKIRRYYENLGMLRNKAPKNVLPYDYDVMRNFRNYAEHSGGGSDIPLCYIVSERKTAAVWDLGLDLAAIVRHVGELPRSRGKAKDYLEALLELSQDKDGIINLSESIDVSIGEATKHHFIDSADMDSDIKEIVPELESALVAAVEDEDIALVDILELYVEREELRRSLAEDAKKLAEAFPKIQILTENN